MKASKRKILVKIIIILSAVIFAILLSGSILFLKTTADTVLDVEKIERTKSCSNIIILDSDGKKINASNVFEDDVYVQLNEIPNYVIQAFISVEDKRFYKHNGIDYIRMAGAIMNNIKSGKFSQGASTISQQLIKNTHLTREKTIKRKLKEIKLAYLLERKYSKQDILEMYLNNIYFGNGCYGIENASKFYFDKTAKELTIGEGAMLAGVINAPSIYDPIHKKENSEKRKQLVLKLMCEDGVLSKESYVKIANNYENIVKNTIKTSKIYTKAIINEVCDILNINDGQLRNKDLVIHTSINSCLQNNISKLVSSGGLVPKTENGENASVSVLVVDNKHKSVVAFSNNTKYNLLNKKRQPGSTIKPLLVYAPALESGNIYPESIIIDESININGYSPRNANKTYLGAISLREAVEKSLNIPAVKTLSNLGVSKAKRFANRLGINFAETDQNLALALGGMTNGVSIKELADAYSTFATEGAYCESMFVNKITDEQNNIIYERKINNEQVMTSATAYLMTDILKGVVENGTAKRLKNISFDIASKTGTVGGVDTNFNTDAINVSYTSEHTIVSWISSNSSGLLPSFVNGATYSTEISKSVLDNLYGLNSPARFIAPDDVVCLDIDTKSLLNNKVEIADSSVGMRDKKSALFNVRYIPPLSKRTEPHQTRLTISMEEGEKPTFMFQTKEDNVYELYRENIISGEKKIVYKIVGVNAEVQCTDKSAKSGEIYEYYIVSTNKYKDYKNSLSNVIKLMSY